MSGNTIETEDTEPSVVQTQDEDSGPQKYVELKNSDDFKQTLFLERKGDSLRLDVVNVVKNFMERSCSMNI